LILVYERNEIKKKKKKKGCDVDFSRSERERRYLGLRGLDRCVCDKRIRKEREKKMLFGFGDTTFITL